MIFVSGKISDDRFAKLSVKYEAEQKEVAVRMKELQEELDSDKSKAVTSDMFMASVRKYTRARKLTPRMLNELIEKIEVHQATVKQSSGLPFTIIVSARLRYLTLTNYRKTMYRYIQGRA